MSKWGDMSELDEPARLRKRVEALEAALKFYATEWVTETDWHPYGDTEVPETRTEPTEALWHDAGRIAHNALEARHD